MRAFFYVRVHHLVTNSVTDLFAHQRVGVMGLSGFLFKLPHVLSKSHLEPIVLFRRTWSGDTEELHSVLLIKYLYRYIYVFICTAVYINQKLGRNFRLG